MSDPVATVYDPRTGWRGWSDGIEVGQVWRCKQDGRRVVITHLVVGWVWMIAAEFPHRKTRHNRSTFQQRYEQVSA